MHRAPIGERVSAAEALRPVWPAFVQELRAFADAAPDATSRVGRLETFARFFDWPEQMAARAARAAEQGARNGHAPTRTS